MSIPTTPSVNTNPKNLIFAGMIVIAIFFGGLGGVAAFMPYSGAVIAPGTVKVQQERKTVQHLEGGIVEQIFVREGDRVEKGDVLIRLKSSQVTSNVALLRGRLAAKMIEGARLEAQRDFRESIIIPDNLPKGIDDIDQLIQVEKDQFDDTRKSLESSINIQKARIRQLEQKIQGTIDEREANTEIMASLAEEIKAKSELMTGRYIDKAQVLTLKRHLAEQKGRKASLNQVLAESREMIEEINFSIRSLENSYRETASANLGQVSDEIFQTRKQLGPQVDAENRLDITAPVTGIVLNMNIHSEQGGVITPGAPILDIVPENADLIVDCRLRQDQITKVFIDQLARVQISAFNRITIPPLAGRVSYISADSVDEQTPQGYQIPSYIIHIRVDPQELEKNKVTLSPGMTATSFITTEKRTFLQYLVEPIMLNLDQSLRETL